MKKYLLNVDANKIIGNIKPMHAVNNAPSFDISRIFNNEKFGKKTNLK